MTSSSSRTGSISLTDLFRLAKTSSDIRPCAGLLRVSNGLVRQIPASETSSRTNMWEAGKIPASTYCSSLAAAEDLGFDEDRSKDGQRLAWGRREVQTASLSGVSGHPYATQVNHGRQRLHTDHTGDCPRQLPHCPLSHTAECLKSGNGAVELVLGFFALARRGIPGTASCDMRDRGGGRTRP